ncbi:MAG TPA: hypothetical protein VNA88_05295, partial [Candidatus Kapabacteria bacterium]|nr:hypothetical protein [Candidatus Kapabacteria bacterium]
MNDPRLPDDAASATPRRVRELIVELAGGSAAELAELLARLRDERPDLYRAFVAAGCPTSTSRAGDAVTVTTPQAT